MSQVINITPEVMGAIINGNGAKTGKKNSTFDAKNYLNTMLEDGEKSKKITIRLLPMDRETGNPFVKVHMHKVIVPEEVSKRGHKFGKNYICLMKNNNIDHEKYGKKCPFCELNKKAYDAFVNETDPVKKEEYKRISLDNATREAVIVRCIERGKESEGVKFWKFNTRLDKTDPYNTILNLYHEREEAGKRKGKVVNILDLYNGKDLTITITEGNAAPTIIDDDEYTPLTDNKELFDKWVHDPKEWYDVFAVKPYEYLKIISESKVPWFDNEKKMWVPKEEIDNSGKNAEEGADEAENLVSESVSVGVSNEGRPTTTTESSDNFMKSIEANDNDLPF